MRRRGFYCSEGCIGGGAGGHHPMCPEAPSEPDHEDGCEPGCTGIVTDWAGAQLGEETEMDCECLCHKEEDE